MHLAQITLDPPTFARWAADARLDADPGYAAHAALRASMGAAGPQPFVYEQHKARVLGYTDSDADALLSQVALLAEPLLARAITDVATKQMPAIAVGATLGFEVRLNPVIRTASLHPDRRVEVDPYEVACRRGEAVDRAQVYHEWLAARLHGATLLSSEIVSHRLVRAARRQSDGVVRRIPGWRSDTVMRGTLRVEDAAEFAATLRAGVGRGRAFGYGALLLRSAAAR